MPIYNSDKYSGIATVRLTYHHALGDLHTDVIILKQGDLMLAEIANDFPENGIVAVSGKTINLTSYKLTAKYSDGTSNASINDWVYSDSNGIISTPSEYTIPTANTTINIASATANDSINIPLTVVNSTQAVSIANNSLINPNSLIPGENYNIQFNLPTQGYLTQATVTLKDSSNNAYVIPSVTVNKNDITFKVPDTKTSNLIDSPYEISIVPFYHHVGDNVETTIHNNNLTIPNVSFIDSYNSNNDKPTISGITPNGTILGKNFNKNTIIITKDSAGNYSTINTNTLNNNKMEISLPSESVKGHVSNPQQSAEEPKVSFTDNGDGTFNLNLTNGGSTSTFVQTQIPSNVDLTKEYSLKNDVINIPKSNNKSYIPEAEIDGFIDSNNQLNINPNNLIDYLMKYGVILNMKRDVLSDLESEQVNTESIPFTKHTGRYVFQTKGKDKNSNIKKSKPIHFLTPPRTIKGLEVLSNEITSTSCIIRWAAEGQNLKFIRDIKIYKKLQSEEDTAYTLVSTTTSNELISAGKHRKIQVSSLSPATNYTFKVVITNNTGSFSDTINVSTIS